MDCLFNERTPISVGLEAANNCGKKEKRKNIYLSLVAFSRYDLNAVSASATIWYHLQQITDMSTQEETSLGQMEYDAAVSTVQRNLKEKVTEP